MKSRIVYKENGTRAENFYGSCVALSIANCIGMSYENVTKFAIKHLPVSNVRKDKSGFTHIAGIYTGVKSMAEGLRKLGRPIQVMDVYGKDGITLKRVKLDTIVKQLPKGRFLVSVRGHMVAVVDNVICDNNYNERTCANGIVRRIIQIGGRDQELPKQYEIKGGYVLSREQWEVNMENYKK